MDAKHASEAVRTEGYISYRGYRTWYETIGDLKAGVPLVLLHGGPGIPGGAFGQLMEMLAGRGPVVRYDQLGCGRSDRPNDPELWSIETFVDELAAIRDALSLERIHILGHSWGGMLAIEYLLAKPAGVQSLTLSSSLASTPFWMAEARRLCEAMPAYTAEAICRFEEHYDPSEHVHLPTTGETTPGIAPKDVEFQAKLLCRMLPLLTTSAFQRVAGLASRLPPLRRAAYEIAGMAYSRRHACRMAKFPVVLCQDFLARNQQLYETMWGPSEFFATGVLAEWDVTARLGEIEVPTLILSGKYDEATPEQQRRLYEGIPGSRWTMLENSAHFGFLEEPDRYQELLSAFLDEVDANLPL